MGNWNKPHRVMLPLLRREKSSVEHFQKPSIQSFRWIERFVSVIHGWLRKILIIVWTHEYLQLRGFLPQITNTVPSRLLFRVFSEAKHHSPSCIGSHLLKITATAYWSSSNRRFSEYPSNHFPLNVFKSIYRRSPGAYTCLAPDAATR
jgi:hypothetical protein